MNIKNESSNLAYDVPDAPKSINISLIALKYACIAVQTDGRARRSTKFCNRLLRFFCARKLAQPKFDLLNSGLWAGLPGKSRKDVISAASRFQQTKSYQRLMCEYWYQNDMAKSKDIGRAVIEPFVKTYLRCYGEFPDKNQIMVVINSLAGSYGDICSDLESRNPKYYDRSTGEYIGPGDVNDPMRKAWNRMMH